MTKPTRTNTKGFMSALLLTIIAIIIVLAITGAGRPAPTAEADVAAQTMPTAVPTAAPLPTLTPTQQPTATTLPTATATATATQQPPTPTPTATATAVPVTITPPQIPTALPTPNGIYSWTLKVPILMYHYISVPPADADIYRQDLSVTPEKFRAQMQYLAENGYTTIDLYDLSLAILGKKELPTKPVILTFDDGYADNYLNAFPVLQEYGFTGTFFVVTEFIDQNREGYMTWEMAKEMAAAGNRIEPHSRTHPDLRGQPREKLIWEILGPQETIAYHLGYKPQFFNYPAGRYDEAVIQILQELNFWGAVTTMGGQWHGYEDRFEWTRVRIRFDTPLDEFMDAVDPGDTVGGKPATP
jgi:peptidoglycan/xylan/chitin deacetylase (PgdA/CDA1 family)